MARTPTVSQVSWIAAVPQLVVLIASIMLISWLLSPGDSFWVLVVYVAYSLLSRRLIAKDHRCGVRLAKRKEFEKALSCFERSYDFFTRHPNLDRYRSIVMLSVSLPGYREMALISIAFCHGQLGNGEEVKRYYRKALELFSDSGLAQTGMNMVLAFEKKE